MTASVTERLVTKLASLGTRRQATRRGFLTAATLSGAALAANPIGYLTRPQSAYAAVCGTDASCSAGYSAFCCTINAGHNYCPPNTYAGGWWKADRSSFCGGAARYYIDCNAKPGYHFTCHCNQTGCDHRLVACNVFRYGQCNTQVHGVTAVVCRQISCRPPWEIYPKCGRSSRTDNNTAGHTAPCLTRTNTFPPLVTWPTAPSSLWSGHVLPAGHRLTSPNRHTTCVMHVEGNLAVHNQYGMVWSSGTQGKARNGSAVMHPDGELVILNASGTRVWGSASVSPGGWPAILQMRDNGDLGILHGGVTVWHTNTHTA